MKPRVVHETILKSKSKPFCKTCVEAANRFCHMPGAVMFLRSKRNGVVHISRIVQNWILYRAAETGYVETLCARRVHIDV